MKQSHKTAFFQRLILVICLVFTLEILEKTDQSLQLSFTQNLNLEANPDNLVSLVVYFTSFGFFTSLPFVIAKNN